jgi:riboflavin synthase
MFTGIIEELGTLKRIQRQGNAARLTVECSVVVKERETGVSIAVNGVCVTASVISDAGFEADLSPETLDRTTLGSLPSGVRVNLERPLAFGGRLDGHLVTGHVDGIGIVDAIRKAGDFMEVQYRAPENLMPFIVEKGSIAVDGISLTVAGLEAERFRVAYIPETAARTNLTDIRVGDRVNLETDLVGKYVARFLESWHPSAGGVTIDLLKNEGYI